MKKREETSIFDARKKVSELIFKVLAQNLCVREAIKSFPPNIDDISIQCAWHALVHYESDEDIRKNDDEFKEEQDNYLEMIGFTLQKGKALPQNMIDEYNKYYDMALIPRSNDFLGWVKRIFRFTI